MEYNDRFIFKTVDINASRPEVWKKWTTREGLISFFPQDCWLELKIGGAFEMYFMIEAERGKQGSEGCEILSFLPEKMLSFSWNAPPVIPAVRDNCHKSWIVLMFKDDGNDTTKVELTHMGFLKGEDWDRTIDYFEKAWQNVLENLKESIG